MDQKSYQAEWYQRNKERRRLLDIERRKDPEYRSKLNLSKVVRYWKDPEKSRQQERDKRAKLSEESKYLVRIKSIKYHQRPEIAAKKRESIKVWRMQNEEGRRNWYMKTNYGISWEKYEQMCKAQNNRCAICRCKPDRLHIDHCHSKRNIRGLLCGNCNRGLGMFHDKEKFLTAAANYLRGSK